MATVDRMRATSEPAKKTRKEALDAALLCEKLEAHLREQEAARLRREKRDTLKNGHYVPRVAAKAFAATSTPMEDFLASSRSKRRASEQTKAVALNGEVPLTTNGKVCFMPLQQYAALDFQWSGQESQAPRAVSQRRDVAPDEHTEITATAFSRQTRYQEVTSRQRPSTNSGESPSGTSEKRRSSDLERWRQSIRPQSSKEESKHDSMNPTSSEGVPLYASQDASPSGRQYHSFRRTSIDKRPATTQDRGRGQYRPGDAAKRRSLEGQRHEQFHYHNNYHGERRPSKFMENETFLDDSIPEDQPTRPKLVPHDRPNWAQQSQTGEQLSLRFLSRKKDSEKEAPRPHSVMGMGRMMAPFGESSSGAKPSRQNSLPENGHLIADAVKKIKKEEKLERRKSIFGLFKRS